MANTRFKGANAGERLTLSTLSDSDMFQTRHLPGTVNDADKGVSKSLLQALPVAVCATAAATAAKVGTLAPESCPDFTLVNGRAVQVYFSTANTASTPTLNLYGTGAIPIVYPDGSFVETWGAGTWMTLMYVSVTIDGTLTQRWVAMNLPADEVAADNMNSVTSNAVEKYVKGIRIDYDGGNILTNNVTSYTVTDELVWINYFYIVERENNQHLQINNAVVSNRDALTNIICYNFSGIAKKNDIISYVSGGPLSKTYVKIYKILYS